MFPNLLHFFWLLLQTFTAFSLIIPAVLCVFYFIHRYLKKPDYLSDELHDEKDYAIIVPSSVSAEKMQALIQSLLQVNYSNYIVYIIGKYTPVTNIISQNDKLVYLRTAKAYENEVLLHRFAIESFRRPHTHMVVIDGDMAIEADFLTRLNFYFHQGYQAIRCNEVVAQGVGIKSILQQATNQYRNFFAGKMMFALGSSATLSCSGIAFSTTFYKQCLKKMKTSDRDFASALQVRVIQCGRQVAFASLATVYRQVQMENSELAKHHALRIHSWLADTFFYCKKVLQGVFNGNKNQFLCGLSSIRLPLPTSIAVAIACLIMNMKIHPAVAAFWAIILMLLPAYLFIAGKQLPGTNNQAVNSLQESIAIYDEEMDYDMIAQSV